jgi:hypothetical protein
MLEDSLPTEDVCTLNVELMPEEWPTEEESLLTEDACTPEEWPTAEDSLLTEDACRLREELMPGEWPPAEEPTPSVELTSKE